MKPFQTLFNSKGTKKKFYCEFCETQIKTIDTRPKLYCSEQCKNKARHLRRPKRILSREKFLKYYTVKSKKSGKYGVKVKSLHGEIWKPIKLNPDRYEVSNLGRVKVKIKLMNYERLLKASGYKYKSFYVSGKNIQIYLHRAIAEAFLPNPKNLKEVNHKDGDKRNNILNNLEWCTSKENSTHARKLGLLPIGEKVYTSKLTVKKVEKIRSLYIKRGKYSSRKLAKIYNVCHTTILDIVNNKNWVNI